MRRNRVRISNIRLYAYRLRLQARNQESNRENNKSSSAEIDYNKIPDFNMNENQETSIFKRKLASRIQRKFRNIKNSIYFCLYTIGDIFSQTFCFIMIRRTKSTGILKSVKI